MPEPSPPETGAKATDKTKMMVIGAICLAVVMMLAISAGSMYLLSRFLKQGPENVGKAPEVVKVLPNGWKRYRFPEMSLQIDLPMAPTVSSRTWQSYDSMTTKSYSQYDFQSSQIGADLNMYEARGSDPYTAEDIRNSEADELKNGKDYKGAKVKQGAMTRDGKKVLWFDAAFSEAGDRVKGRSLFWQNGKKVCFARFGWHPDNEFGKKEVERIEKSMKL